MSELLVSRKFWVTLFSLFVIVMASFIPGFDFDGETAAGFVIIIAALIIGLAVDPGRPEDKWKHFFGTRKFWSAAVGLLVVFLNAFKLVLPFGMNTEQFIAACISFSSLILGFAFEKKDGTKVEQIESIAKTLLN